MKVWIDALPWMDGAERIEVELERINGVTADISTAGMRITDYRGTLYAEDGTALTEQELSLQIARAKGQELYDALAASGSLDGLIEAKERMDRLLSAMRENALLRAIVDRVTGTQDG